MQRTEKRNIVWIDCGKTLAILAVPIDHLKGILYQDETIQYIFFYSVAVFFFLSGMTSFHSLKYRREQETLLGWVIRRVWRIGAPYLVAVAVYQYMRSGCQWNLGAFVLWALHFNLEGQFYFVLIYLQLLLAAPVLYLITSYFGNQKPAFLFRSIWLVTVWGLSMFCMDHTFALETYGGGKYLFGGTYLFLFVLGMVASDMELELKCKRDALLSSGLSILLFGGSLAFLLTDRLAWDESLFGWTLRVNPPGPTMIVYSLAVIFLIFSLCSLAAMLQKEAVDRFLKILAWPGKYTLYIFLYHILLLDAVLPKIPGVSSLPVVLKALVYMGVMICLPAAGKIGYDRLRGRLVRAEREKRLLSEK